jgi:poly-gamma-glutamate synthesis protein (capsule biosynthesis protein)
MRSHFGLLGVLLGGFVACQESPTGDHAARRAQPTASASASAPAPNAKSSTPALDAAPTPTAKADRLVVLVGGDVSLGRGAGQQILKDPKYDPFRSIAPLMRSADIRIVNLESQLSDQKGQTQHPNNHLVFTGPPAGAEVLSRAGIELVSLANNHAWDYGKGAFFETLDNLERAGVRYAGASRERSRIYEPTVISAKGFSVAVFGVTDIWNQGPIQEHEGRHHVAWAAFKLLEAPLAKARKEHDLVLVLYHGGGEYLDVPMQWTRSFVSQVMAAGVDAFFGHHPHVPHGVAWHAGKPAFYSLGNLVFAMHSDYPWTGTSFMARVTFHSDGRLEAEACPYHVLGHLPMPFEGKTRLAREGAFRAHLQRLSAATGGAEVGDPGELSCMKLAPRTKKQARP